MRVLKRILLQVSSQRRRLPTKSMGEWFEKQDILKVRLLVAAAQHGRSGSV